MKKLLTFILAFVMLLSLASCKEDEEETKPMDNEANTEASADDGDIFAERAAVEDGLGEYDFGGKTFRIITHRPYDFVIEEDQVNKGDLIKDSTAERNKRVEDRFNCKVDVVYTSGYTEMNTYVTKNVMSGADEFDLLCAHTLLWEALLSRTFSSTGMTFPMLIFQSLGGLPITQTS